MATIIDLSSRLSRLHHPARAAASSADVVLFPGVRYERWSEDKAASDQPKARRPRRRDCLDLDD
ncbi:MAG: hypothetical protein WC807_09845 [Hyphomicrobium sp.]|jgi:hypothetical protein